MKYTYAYIFLIQSKTKNTIKKQKRLSYRIIKKGD